MEPSNDNSEVTLVPELAETLSLLKAKRGTCPSTDLLVEYEGLDPLARRTHPIHSHARLCSTCLLLIDRMSAYEIAADADAAAEPGVQTRTVESGHAARVDRRVGPSAQPAPALLGWLNRLFLFRPPFSAPLAIALGSIVLGVAVWSLRLRVDLSKVTADRQSLQAQLDVLRTRRESELLQLNELRQQYNQKKEEIDRVNRLLQERRQIRPDSTDFPGIASMILVPGVVRGAPVNRLVLSDSVRAARIELPVKGNAVLTNYKAELENSDGKSLSTVDMLLPHVNRDQVSVVWMLQSDVLVPGDYVVNVRGRSVLGELEVAPTIYQFRVVRP